jgi:nitroreductase
MQAIEAIITRRVQRAFDSREVEPDKLDLIVDAGRHAMSARNMQPWQFIVVRSRDTLKRIGELCSTGRFVTDAPAAVVVLKNTENTRWADIDCAQAVQNMAVAGWSVGLGTCWVGNFDNAKISEILAVRPPWTVFTILPFGYRDPARPPEARPLRPRNEMVHYERFGNSSRGS